MRRFLVGSCCVIVALQVLIGVPLAVCIAFFSLVEIDAGPVAVEMQPAAWNETSLPYENPGPALCSGYCPSTAATAPPIISPPVAVPMVPNSLVAASPVLSGDKAPAEVADEYIAAFKQVAEEETGIAPPASEADSSCHRESPLIESLRQAASHLYELAQNLEAEGNYSRADQIRELARDIRGEIGILKQDRSPPMEASVSVTATALPTVTEAPFNPEPPPAPEDAASSLNP